MYDFINSGIGVITILILCIGGLCLLGYLLCKVDEKTKPAESSDNTKYRYVRAKDAFQVSDSQVNNTHRTDGFSNVDTNTNTNSNANCAVGSNSTFNNSGNGGSNSSTGGSSSGSSNMGTASVAANSSSSSSGSSGGGSDGS